MLLRRKFFNLSILLCGLIFFCDASAQDNENSVLMNQASQYYLGDKDEILMNVNVWGYVKRPGQYVVPRHTDLISLLSFAGGPIEGAKLNKVMIVRAGHLMEETNGTNGQKDKVPILTVDVKSHLKKGEISKIPILKANDTVVVSQTFGNKVQGFIGFNSILGIITAMASTALIIDRL